MENKRLKIVVSGDICVNLLQWRTDQQCTQGLNWQSYPHVHNSFKNGEALLLSKFVALATQATQASISSPQIQDIEATLPKELLRSTVELELFPETLHKNDNHKVYRISRYLGFTGLTSGMPMLLPIIEDDENADMVILDDEDNGFNANEEFWPLAIKTPGKSPIVIYKVNHPTSSSELWHTIRDLHIQNTIVVINSDDLRAKGVNISKSLSWERTAQDFVWQISHNPDLSFLAHCHHLIVPFGLEGAIYYQNKGVAESQLYFLTYEFEGGFIKDNQGKMFGLTSCFVAALSRNIAAGICNKEEFSKSIGEGIREGIVAAQKYFVYGFGETIEESAFPNPLIFKEAENDFVCKEHIQDVLIRDTNNPSSCDTDWYIIKDKSSSSLADIAYNIVKSGEKSALKFIPIAQFGKLKTVDRAEIEGYRSIKNLMSEYISTKNTVRPLCIAVFGTPGSGKSFGVAEVASSIAPDLTDKLDFNLSQFQSVTDLFAAFHKVRDLCLKGKVPLVFFDEFDSAFEGNLGWLKYFLAPMQDGEFREGDSIHPIGKAIFVFAGGTSSTFQEFGGEDITDELDYKHFLKDFQSAKGPDFVSRLRGYVNILGPNQTDEQKDQLFIVRRAMLLRSLLALKVPHLLNERGEAQIDNGILRAMLKVTRYKHESRSMEAILEMSMLTDSKKWEQSHLPSKEQLKLHVDEEQFLRRLMHDAFYSEKFERLATDLHRHTLLNNDKNASNSYCIKSWETLGNELKESIYEQIKHIPDALYRIGYDIISVKEKLEAVTLTERELMTLAEYEHERWLLQKKDAGWKLDTIIDEEKKLHPLLVPWKKVPDHNRNELIVTIKFWPEILANSNFKIERLKFLSYCEIGL